MSQMSLAELNNCSKNGMDILFEVKMKDVREMLRSRFLVIKKRKKSRQFKRWPDEIKEYAGKKWMKVAQDRAKCWAQKIGCINFIYIVHNFKTKLIF